MIRRSLLALLLFVLPLQSGVIIVQGTAAPGVTCTEVINDDFSASTFGSGNDWYGGRALDQTECPWSIGSSQIRNDDNDTTNPKNACDNKSFSVMESTDLNNVDQYACITYISQNQNYNGVGVTLRAASQTATGDQYQVFATIGTSTMQWGAADFGPDIGSCTGTTLTANDRLCARVEGTGSATTMEFWINPTGTDPDDWGASDCCVDDTGASLRGTTCTADTLGDWTAPVVTDTGDFVGVRIRSSNVDGTANMVYDNFLGGDCS